MTEDLKERKPALSGVLGSATRHRRASSIGDSALKRLSKAFDSVNLPNFSTSSLFSASHKHDPSSPSPATQSPAALPTAAHDRHSLQADPGSEAVASHSSRDSSALERALSDDSALYHPLSRSSSFGDDDRWMHIREQVNIRMKAIKDSWDAPTFKLPSKFNNKPCMHPQQWRTDSTAQAYFQTRSRQGRLPTAPQQPLTSG